MRITTCILLFFFFVALFCKQACGADYRVTAGEIKEEAKDYTIVLQFPRIEGCSNKASEDALNRIITTFIGEQKKEFLKERSREKGGSGLPWSLDFNYEVEWKDRDHISIVFLGSIFSGGAHPSPVYYTLLYDFNTMKELKLGDIFKKDSRYLQEISRHCISELEKSNVSDSQWIDSGASPKQENYSFFYITGHDLVIIFPPYQVACYAAGTQEIPVPIKLLKDMIKPDGPLGRLVK